MLLIEGPPLVIVPFWVATSLVDKKVTCCDKLKCRVGVSSDGTRSLWSDMGEKNFGRLTNQMV